VRDSLLNCCPHLAFVVRRGIGPTEIRRTNDSLPDLTIEATPMPPGTKKPPREAVLVNWQYRQTRLVLDFAVQCMTTKKLVILLFLNAIWLLLFIATSHIAGYWFALGACLSAFNHYVFSGHTKILCWILKKERKLGASRAEATLFSPGYQ